MAQIARSEGIRPARESGPPLKQSRPQPRRGPWSARLGSYLFAIAVLYAVYWGWSERGEEHLTAEHGLGYILGIVGSSFMLVMLVYPLRKRLRFMRNWGRVAVWFRLHMFLGVLGPLLVLFHANFSWGSFNSNIALASMLSVVASGLIGRFIYARVHHGLYGRRASVQEFSQEMQERRVAAGLDAEFAPAAQKRLATLEKLVLAEPMGVVTSARRVLAAAVLTRLVAPALNREAASQLRAIAEERGWSRSARNRHERAIRGLLSAYLESVRRIVAFAFFERLFGLWHVLHMPLFIILVVSAVAPVRGGDKVFHWSGGDLRSRRSKIQPVLRRFFVLWTKGSRRDVCRGGLRGGSAICFQ